MRKLIIGVLAFVAICGNGLFAYGQGAVAQEPLSEEHVVEALMREWHLADRHQVDADILLTVPGRVYVLAHIVVSPTVSYDSLRAMELFDWELRTLRSEGLDRHSRSQILRASRRYAACEASPESCLAVFRATLDEAIFTDGYRGAGMDINCHVPADCPRGWSRCDGITLRCAP